MCCDSWVSLFFLSWCVVRAVHCVRVVDETGTQCKGISHQGNRQKRSTQEAGWLSEECLWTDAPMLAGRVSQSRIMYKIHTIFT